MKRSYRPKITLAALMLFSMVVPAARALDRNDVIGTWEGESKCTVPNSPCHDEHVIYEIVGDKRSKEVFRIDAYKLVEGQRAFMGAIDCTLTAASSALTCVSHGAKEGVWEFKIDGEHMTGTLTVGPEKQLYRKISVDKHAP